ncbi:alpha/beta fold hydrolase [Paenibacillus antri]|uniref:Alpha/beta fold hydrolase n=1 Tax=Paenibacillus antri TaxID=2582848 RepID=A0A5R9FWW7_9BACL|nr:alpha/beta fold hydrolase [Paenibacillus antri]TLS48522.1 alpha/beta fold hydrolase [Paenibacillus antri]
MKMKRLAASAAALALLANAVPAAAADDRSPVALWVNGSALTFADASPYEEAGAVLVPVRAAAERLGFRVSFDPGTYAVSLSSSNVDVSFRVGAASATVNGRETAFAPASAVVSNRVFVPLSFFETVLGFETAYRADVKAAEVQGGALDPKALVADILRLLIDGKYQQLSDEWFADEMKAAVPVEALASGWESAAPIAGAFLGVAAVQSAPLDAETLGVEAVAAFERMNFKVSLAINGERQRLVGLLLQPAAAEAEAPDAVVEEEVVVGAGTAYELGGTLTLPAAAEGPVPAVVLVQGSGPSDRNETAGAYTPFRDLAWGLAQQGIAVLRYDKRTYAYGDAFTPEEAAAITVAEESVDDAVAAAELLKRDERIDASQVYVIGHSQGGMLAPRIDAEGGDFAGLVLLAGSPRTLWELIYDQNMAFIEAMDDADPAKRANLDYVEAEYKKAQGVAAMSVEEAKNSTVFGFPAYYFKEMDAFDLPAYVDGLKKPVLVLQGEDDFQVYAEKDFAKYKEIFGERDDVTYKLYPGLNHFFVDYDGPGAGTLGEYNVPGAVSQHVIDDIAAWISKMK